MILGAIEIPNHFNKVYVENPMNAQGTNEHTVTVELPDPQLYELIDANGVLRGHYRTPQEAARHTRPDWLIRPAGEFMHHRAKHGPVNAAGKVTCT